MRNVVLNFQSLAIKYKHFVSFQVPNKLEMFEEIFWTNYIQNLNFKCLKAVFKINILTRYQSVDGKQQHWPQKL